MKLRRWVAMAGMLLAMVGQAHAQDTDGPLSQAEVESLREVAPVPVERMKAFEKILETRVKAVEDLLAKPKRPGYALDMHDALDQFAKIADEFNDNLDEYSRQHRDVRKELPKLLRDAERWTTALRAPPEDDGYKIVKKIALDNLGDMRELAGEMQTEQAAYFKEHPEAARAEAERVTGKQ